LVIVLKIWQEEKRKGLKESRVVPFNVSQGWLTLSILVLWFGFNLDSVLAFNSDALVFQILSDFLLVME
jgi:Amt family ammonium transporter